MLPTAEWDPEHEAVWRENAPGTTRAINLRHPTYPFEATLDDDQSPTLIRFAAKYFAKVKKILGLTDILGEIEIFDETSAQFRDSVPLMFLDVHSEENTPAPPGNSFWVSRYEDPRHHTHRIDRTAVILAVQSALALDKNRMNRKQALGSRLGVRIVMHVRSTASAKVNVQITSASCSIGLPEALSHQRGPTASDFVRTFLDADAKTRSDMRSRLRRVAGFGDGREVFYDGLRLIESSLSHAIVDVYMTAPPPPDRPRVAAYAVAARLLVSGPDTQKVLALETWPLVAHADPVRTKVFVMDPASEAGLGNLIDSRPNRSPDRLKKYLHTRTLAGVTLGPFYEVRLHDDLDQVRVLQSKLVDRTADETLDQIVFPLCIDHPRRNDFAAISAYQHARGLEPAVGPPASGLLDTMRSYGLSPVQYFRFAALPLHVRYRTPIDHGGKDGRVVNAQVNFEGLDGDVIATDQTAPPFPLQLKFALADVKRSSSRRQPLGIATDPRWYWHECGHVLLAAWTGSLQFRFAHSAGDSLAAVLADPESNLAAHPRLRGLTFPWVYLHRRHDRDVFLGWSWSGRYHRPARFTTDVNTYRRKGYESEQILSSSLFRLYRALGGDATVVGGTEPDRGQRRRASDYPAYLIMKAIQFMPPAFINPLETPDEFVTALVDADISTLPAASGPLRDRVGGWAYKVVRWAFEAQGLYAATDPLEVVDEPGKPQDPDVFIDDRRPDSAGHFPRGGYMPVSLHWEGAFNPPNPPLWQATDEAIQVVAGTVTVEVSTRGPLSANQVTVAVWWTTWIPNTPVPRWNDGSWQTLAAANATQTVAPWPARTTFGPFSGAGLPPFPGPPGTRVLIVAAATCSADASNTVQSLAIPCSMLETPLIDLVAGDNNIGLKVYVVP